MSKRFDETISPSTDTGQVEGCSIETRVVQGRSGISSQASKELSHSDVVIRLGANLVGDDRTLSFSFSEGVVSRRRMYLAANRGEAVKDTSDGE